MLLQNFDNIKKYFDLETGQELVSLDLKKTKGWYKEIDKVMSALFVDDYKLFLMWNGNKYILEKGFTAELKATKLKGTKRFLCHNATGGAIKFNYQTEEPFNDISPFEYLDEEDFDWGLFLLRIINDPEKQLNVINNFMATD